MLQKAIIDFILRNQSSITAGVIGIVGSIIGSILTFNRSIKWQENKNKLRRVKNYEQIIAELTINKEELPKIEDDVKAVSRFLIESFDMTPRRSVRFLTTSYNSFMNDIDVNIEKRRLLHSV